MLFYSRLKGTQKDYLFEFINLHTCIKEVLEDYMPLLEKSGFRLKCRFLKYSYIPTEED